MSEPALQTSELTKVYRGRRVLDAVELEVESGSIFGFLGQNGAGKTTTLRLVTGLTRPTSGTVRVLGRDVATGGTTAHTDVGFLPDVPAFYDWMTAPEFLRFAGDLVGVEHRTLKQRIDMLLDTAGLAGVATRIGGFSRGMRQRLGIAQALIGAPRLLLLDEPTSALDPLGRKDVLDLIASLQGRTTVFFSTHLLGDVERVCDTVAVLDGGRVLTQAPLAELRSRYTTSAILLEVTDRAEQIEAALKTQPWVSDLSLDPRATGSDPGAVAITVTVTDIEEARHGIPAIAAATGAGLARLDTGEQSLENVFVELVSGRAPDTTPDAAPSDADGGTAR